MHILYGSYTKSMEESKDENILFSMENLCIAMPYEHDILELFI